MVKNAQFFQPASKDEILSILPQLTPKSRILGGGTDLLATREILTDTDIYLSLCACKELSEIHSDGKYIYIGATATHNAVANNQTVKEHINALAMACASIGSQQIRNRGTIAGNMGNASPAGDTLAPLFMFGAEIEVMSPEQSSSWIPVDKVVTGPYQNSLAHNHVMLRIRIPIPAAGTRSVYVKLGSRSRVTIVMIGLAISGIFKPDGLADNISAYIGAITGQPVRIPTANDILAGKKPGNAEKDALGHAVYEFINELTPLQFDKLYKEKAAKGIAYDGVEALFG